ncbi:MAG: deoxyguanosinetriphosphate triphosphohydrolase [Oscillospiraceae bacterium]
MPTVRERYEKLEHTMLCKSACFSSESGKRAVFEEKCPLRTDFQRDRDRIIHSNSFRRLKQKTQVFLVPEGDHYRTRLTHTLEVAQIARTIARGLRLNEDLTEAVALGHDLGHTPFGHSGEAVLNIICPDGFKHYIQSGRVVEYIEKGGKGLNLTEEVIDGIISHTNMTAKTKEGYIVRLADRIAYINHDIDDAIRAGILKESDLPKEITDILGNTKTERITTLVSSIVENGVKKIAPSDEIAKAHEALHTFMYERVYKNPIAKKEEEKAKLLIEKLYIYFYNNPDKLPLEYRNIMERFDIHRAVCDYIAGMTDGYAIALYEELFIPKAFELKFNL